MLSNSTNRKLYKITPSLIMLSIFFPILVWSQTIDQVSVSFKDLDNIATGQQWRRLAFKIHNNSSSSVDLSQIKLLYTMFGNDQNLLSEIWYYNVHNENWTIQGGELSEINAQIKYYSDATKRCDLVLYFKQRMIPAGGIAEIQLGLHNSNWSTIDENMDPCYIATSTYVENKKINIQAVTVENMDSDEDGVPDIAEVTIGQNPNSKNQAYLVLQQSKWASSQSQDDIVTYTSPYNSTVTGIIPAGTNDSNYCPIMVMKNDANYPAAIRSTGGKPLYWLSIYSSIKQGVSINYPLFVPPQYSLQGFKSSACFSIFQRQTNATNWQQIAVDSLKNGAIYFQTTTLAAEYIVTYNPGRVVFVNASVSGGDGSSWDNAYSDLQQALTHARTLLANLTKNDYIDMFVAKGTYYPGLPGDRNAVFDIPSNIHMYGGFAGDGTMIRDNVLNESILCGDLDNDGKDDDDSYHVIKYYGPEIYEPWFVTAVIDGFSIVGGNANNPSYVTNSGGGLWVYNMSGNIYLNIMNCVFRNNYSSYIGGAIHIEHYNIAGNINIANCTFNANQSENGGAVGISCGIKAVNTVVTNCTFKNNIANNNLYTGGNGGAIYIQDWNAQLNSHSEFPVSNCFFYSNSGLNGSAVFAVNSSTKFYGCVFSQNISSASMLVPLFATGTLYLNGTQHSLTNCTLVENMLSWAPKYSFSHGTVFLQSGNLDINNSILLNKKMVNQLGFWSEIERSAGSTSNVSHSLLRLAPDGSSAIDNDLGGNIEYDYTNNLSAVRFDNMSNPLGADNKFGTFDDGLCLLDVNSPLYNSGLIIPNVTTKGDILGQTRGTGNPDIGAYWLTKSEYTSVDFLENQDQSFGFDRVSYSPSDPTTADIYISLAKNIDPINHPENSKAKVNIVAQDLSQSLYARSSDESVFKIQGNTNHIDIVHNNNTVIDLYGQSISGDYAEAFLDICRQDGSVIRSLNVKVYAKLSIPNINCYYVIDSQSPNALGTLPLSMPTFSAMKTQINNIFKQAIVDVVSISGNNSIDLHYDENGNGILDYYWGDNNPEIDQIDENTVFTGDSKIAIVAKMRNCTRLTEEIFTGSEPGYITLETTDGVECGKWYILGPVQTNETWTNIDNNAEAVKFYQIIGNKAYIDMTFNCNHSVGQVLYPLQSSLSGLSTNPQLISSDSNILNLIAHEMMHRIEHPALGGLKDVKENDNLMVYMDGPECSGIRLRYRDQTCVNTGVGTVTGETEGQWNKIHRIGYGILEAACIGDCLYYSPLPGIYKLGTKLSCYAVGAHGYWLDQWLSDPVGAITITDPSSEFTEMIFNSDGKITAKFTKP